MCFVEWSGARCARRTRMMCLPPMAAVICWLFATHGARAQDVPADDGRGDLFAEVIGGTLGLATGALVGFGTGFIAMQSQLCRPGEELCGLGPAIFGLGAGALGILLLTPAGVSIAGAHTGGRGSYWAALCGAAVGFAGWFSFLATFAPRLDDVGIALTGFAVLTVVGAIIDYRVSPSDRVAVGAAFDGQAATLAFGVRL